MNKRISLALLTMALLGVAPAGLSSQHLAPAQGSDQTSAKDVRREVGDAAESIKDYGADKRDEAARNAKAALDDLDARIKAMEARIDRDWDKMDKAAREQARATLEALRKQRVEVAEWFGALKNSTAGAWKHVKKGFSDSYKSLKNAWEKAEREYGEERKK